MELLAAEMDELTVVPSGNLRQQPILASHRFNVNYSASTGKRLRGEGRGHEWNLSTGAKVKVTAGPGKGFKGKVIGRTAEGHYRISLPHQREGSKQHGTGCVVYILGRWFIDGALD